MKYSCSIDFILNSTYLIYRATDISKYFRESLDNERRVYIGNFTTKNLKFSDKNSDIFFYISAQKQIVCTR